MKRSHNSVAWKVAILPLLLGPLAIFSTQEAPPNSVLLDLGSSQAVDVGGALPQPPPAVVEVKHIECLSSHDEPECEECDVLRGEVSELRREVQRLELIVTHLRRFGPLPERGVEQLMLENGVSAQAAASFGNWMASKSRRLRESGLDGYLSNLDLSTLLQIQKLHESYGSLIDDAKKDVDATDPIADPLADEAAFRRYEDLVSRRDRMIRNIRGMPEEIRFVFE